uniref:Uncharacterized protein n=1 Tax=Arundo donax TaxID=35708 RepID=A0A0A8ZDE3_ARUDO
MVEEKANYHSSLCTPTVRRVGLFSRCRRYVTAPVRRARRTGRRRHGRSPGEGLVLEQQRRRVGLHEDGPEYLHVLAGARLDVLVQYVDPPLLLLRGMHADPELLERREERLEPARAHGWPSSSFANQLS